jgi:hypothetical protein
MLTIFWKYALVSWYEVEVDFEHKAFIKDTVWGQAVRRFAKLCRVQLKLKYRHAQARALARGTHEPTTKYNDNIYKGDAPPIGGSAPNNK